MAKIHNVKKPTEILELLETANFEELEVYTRRIQNHPKQVLQFEEIFDSFFEDGGDINREDSMGSNLVVEVFESHDELKNHLASMPKYRHLGDYLVFFNHGGGEVTAEFGWDDTLAGRVLWDRWHGVVGNPVQAFAQIGWDFDILDYQCVPKPRNPQIPAMYRYHPERYRAYRAFAPVVAEIYRREAPEKSGLISLETMQKIGNLIQHEMNKKGLTYPLRRKPEISSVSGHFNVETSLATAYGRFEKSGKQIMHFPPELTELLARTDVESVPMKTIKLPYSAQYLYLGPQKDLELEPGWFVDGAYVESRGEPGDLRFTLTTCPEKQELASTWYVSPEPYYSQDYIETYRESDLAHAIDGVLAERMEEFSKRLLEKGGDITQKIREEFEKEGGSIPEDMVLIDKNPQSAYFHLVQEKRRHPIYRSAMRLVVNALCYLTAYPDDISTVWPEGTPENLKKRSESEDKKTATKAISKLASMGYNPVYICGRRVAEQREVTGISAHHHGVATHWRRGHWRNQAYGPGMSLRKLLWIMPVLVGVGEENNISGHIYLVGNRENPANEERP